MAKTKITMFLDPDLIEWLDQNRDEETSRSAYLRILIRKDMKTKSRRKNASVLTNMDSGWNNARLPFQEVKLSLKDKNFVINYKKSRDGKFQFSDSSMSTIYDWQDDFIDVEISGSRLRSKIEKDSSKPDLIFTVRGVGYMFYNY